MKKYCNECDKMKDTVKTRRQNTSYQNDKLNRVICCKQCFDKKQSLWAEMWKEHGR